MQERTITLEFKWTVSRGRDTYGYNICTLYADGARVSRCNGGGYDMEGTALGLYLAAAFADRLRKLPAGGKFYGLSFHDPHYDPGKAIVGRDVSDRTLRAAGDPEGSGLTVSEAEAKGISFGLERYQAIYAASSEWPTERHTIPSIDGACGMSSVQRIGEAIGLSFESGRTRSKNQTIIFMTVGTDPNA